MVMLKEKYKSRWLQPLNLYHANIFLWMFQHSFYSGLAETENVIEYRDVFAVTEKQSDS